MISQVVSIGRLSSPRPSLSLLVQALAVHKERKALAQLSAAQCADLGLDQAAIHAELSKPILQALKERSCR